MKKGILVPSLALTIIGAGVITTSVFATPSDNLEKEATITQEEATTSALKKVAGKVVETELENEDGKLVYEIEVKDEQGKIQEVEIDAKTGEVLKIEAEEDDDKEDNVDDSENESDKE